MMLFTEPMMFAAIIMSLTFLGIFTEQFHGIERAKFALAGAGAILFLGQLYGFYTPEMAIFAIDWNVIFLLAIMMIIIAIMVSTGGFNRVANHINDISGGSQIKLLVMMGATVSLLSMLLDNVTTVIIFAPLLVLICRDMAVSPVPYLMAAAILSNTGGIATLVGDPPNLMIGSSANIGFNAFFIHMSPMVLLAWSGMLVMLLFMFRHELAKVPNPQKQPKPPYKNQSLWRKSLFVLSLMVGLFVSHETLNWPPWLVAGICLTLLLFMSNKVELEKVTNHLEVPLLIFFVALFILIGGVEKSGLLEALGERFTPLIMANPQLSALILLWVAALLSALIDNIPFTAAMIPVLLSLQMQGVNVSVLWWSLALGVGLGGNGTHIGSTANVYVMTISERLAKEHNDPQLAISPSLWIQKGLPATLVGLLLSSAFIWFAYEFLYIAL